jgi:hypothetical protein
LVAGCWSKTLESNSTPLSNQSSWRTWLSKVQVTTSSWETSRSHTVSISNSLSRPLYPTLIILQKLVWRSPCWTLPSLPRVWKNKCSTLSLVSKCPNSKSKRTKSSKRMPERQRSSMILNPVF